MRFWLLPLLVGCTEYAAYTDTREEIVDDYFSVEGVRVDIMFVADTSDSMTRELLDLSRNVTQFTDRLDESDADWRIITVTGPEGCSTAGVLDPAMNDWESDFERGVTTEPGQDNVDEWGLFNAFQAAMEARPGGCNEGFLRDEAALHVIFLSDERDTSPGWQAEGSYWRDYVDPILYLKDSGADVKFSAVTGPSSGCEGADPGLGYLEAASATSGEQLSICTDWLPQLGHLADESIVQDFFALSWAPLDPTDIAVDVNGEPRTDGWTYEVESQGVRFTESPPVAWDEVHVKYRALVEYEVEGPPPEE